MSMSRRAKRMERTHKRNSQAGGLNLTALMDIFTILVFFLMVNQSDVTVQNNDSIELPVSIASKQPEEQVTVLITKDDILVQGRTVAKTAQVIASNDEEIAELKEELEYLAKRTPLQADEINEGRPITIMGDKSTAYSLLKKVMNTCAKAEFNNISLAIEQAGGEGA